MGEMFVYYASSDVAFIGGSLLPFGGQNLIEAATMGKPLIIGPHTYNFEEIAEQAVSRGAALRVADTTELQGAIQNLMQDAALCSKMGEASLEFSRSAGGTAVKIADMVQPYLFST
jgi:3-deoxy-D-manno-octulosonic-acid transferase